MVPRVIVDIAENDFEEEKDPFDGPAPEEQVDQEAGSFRGDQGDAEPDADAGNHAPDEGQKDYQLTVVPEELPQDWIVFPQGKGFGKSVVDSRPDGEMGNKNMNDGDDRDHHRATQIRHFPNRIIHNVQPITDCTIYV